MNNFKSLTFLFFAVALTLSAVAKGVIVQSGDFDVTFKGCVVDSLTNEALPSAVISVVTKHDDGIAVRNYVADGKGNFQFGCISLYPNRMEVSVLGYKPQLIYLDTDEREQNLGVIRMSQSTEKIDEVVVKARIQMYKMKGDTVIYMPRAVSTMKDDAVSEILRHMPGVEVSAAGAVTILGQPVERTYVNEKLLFGDDPTVAIRQIEAKEVASIQSYDEVDEQDAIANGKNARKRKVLNIVTFKEFTQSMHAKVRGETGADFRKDGNGDRPVRYAASGDAGYYSEKMQVSASGQTNNLTMTGGVSSFPILAERTTDADASISGKVGTQHRYNARYVYQSFMSKGFATQSTDYFPTDDFTSQRTMDTTRYENRHSGHSLAAGYGYIGNASQFNTDFDVGIANDSNMEAYATWTRRSGTLLSATDRLVSTNGNFRFLRWSVDGSYRLKNGHSLMAGGKINLDDKSSQGRYLEQQLSESSPFVRDQDLYESSPDNTYEARLGYGIDFEEAGNFSFAARMEHTTRMKRKLYADAQTGILDWVRSEDAHDKAIAWSIGPNYSLRWGDAHVSASLQYNLDSRTYEDEKYGTADRRRFHFVTGMLFYGINKPKKNFSVTLSSDCKPVNGTELSSRIDDSNPLFINTGNAALVPSKNYDLWARGEFMHRQSSLAYALSFVVTTDPIVRRRTYYKEATVLPEYGNYVVPAGASFFRPENGAAYLSCRIGGSYKTRISPLRLFVVLAAEYRYANPQHILNDRTGRSNHHTGELSLDLTTNFSSRLRIGVKNSAGIDAQSGLGVSSREIREQINARVQWDVVNNLFFSTDYAGIFRFASHNNTLPSNHLMNVSVGYRLLKERARITFNAYDVLNSYSPVSISQGIQAITAIITRTGSSYFTLSFEYKFNNRKSVN